MSTPINRDENEISKSTFVEFEDFKVYDFKLNLAGNPELFFETYLSKFKSNVFDLLTGYELNSPKSIDTNEEFSDYNITSEGIVEEQWNSIQNIPSRILEVSKEWIDLECLIDLNNFEFENRRFEKSLFLKNIPLVQYQPVMIKIFKRPGEIKYKFINGKNLFDIKLFEDHYFSALAPEKLTKRL